MYVLEEKKNSSSGDQVHNQENVLSNKEEPNGISNVGLIQKFRSSLTPKHRLHISIRTQLIALVLFVSLFSLLTLAIATGVYFSTVLKRTRASNLEVAAQLKAAQMEQGFNYYYYQALLLSSKESIQSALVYRKAGNASSSLIDTAETTIDQFLETTTMFNGVRLYDTSFGSVATVTGPNTGLNNSEIESLYILSEIPQNPPDILLKEGGFIWGPVQSGNSYFASFSLAINTNSTFLIQERSLAGYMTLIMNITVLNFASDNTSSSDGQSVEFVKPDFPINNSSDVNGFSYVFQPNDLVSIDTVYDLDSYEPVDDMFGEDKSIGYTLNVKNPIGQGVSVGYALIDFTYGKWGVTLEQLDSKFMEPVMKLTKMMVGVCIGISALMLFITFILAHYGVRPIRRLQKAAETITERRGLRSNRHYRHHHHSLHSKRASLHFKSRSRKEKKLQREHSWPPVFQGSHLSPSPCNIIVTSTSQDAHESEASQTAVRKKAILASSSVPGNTSGSLRSSIQGRSRQDSEGYLESYSVTEASTDAENNATSTPLPAIVPIHGIFYDELTELTEAFNTMTEELDKQYSHLEDRVRARTKELEIAKIQADAARQQAEAANEAKTVFIANISHELRTPLNGIMGMTSVAMAEKDKKKIRSSLDLIFRSGELLLHILTQLLTFSKNQLDKTKLQRRNFVLLEVASQIESIFGKTATDQDVNLIVQLKPDLSRKMIMLGDSNRIIQIVMNLVSNSLKFTPKNGTVKVVIKVLGYYDEKRSKEENYGKVYIKGVNEAPEINTPFHPESLRRRLSDSGDSMKSSKSESTLNTLSSEEYHNQLADAYNYGVSKSYFDEEDGEFLNIEDTSDSDNHRLHECHEFKDVKKYWVVRFSVSDTGTGIEKSLQEKIFEAFVQGDQTLSRSHGGTGLGLSICKQFAKLMHGTLILDSVVGQGSTFTFTVPLPQVGELIIPKEQETDFYDDVFNPKHPPSKRVKFMDGSDKSSGSLGVKESGSWDNPGKNGQQNLLFDPLSNPFVKPELITRASTGTAKSKISADREQSGSIVSTVSSHSASSSHSSLSESYDPVKAHLRFLVAEDNLVNQEVVKRMMKLEGYTDVTLACDGFEAIDLVKQSQKAGKKFDLILMDVQMPKLDGISATRIIRYQLGYTYPIVALTAFADKSNEDECIEVGMSGFLSKPVRRNLLRKIIKQFCNEPDISKDCGKKPSNVSPFKDDDISS